MKGTSWILAARPKTLTAAVAPVIVGTALAFGDSGRVYWGLAAFALLGALFIQIGTNLINDALDFTRGADSHARLGPVRVSQAGLLSPRVVMNAAWISFALATICGIPLIIRGGLPILLIGAASLIAAYAYTGGPYPLAYHGLGELFVIIFFGVIAVGGSYYVQTLALPSDVILAGLAIGSLATVLLTINNLRDINEDRAAGKRTVAVRLGVRLAKIEVALFVFIPFVLILVLAINRPILALPIILLPLAIVLIRRVQRTEAAALNRCLALAAGLQLTFALILAAAAASYFRF